MLAYAIKTHPFFADNIAVDLPECDITNLCSVEASVNEHNPEYIINCAAYTDVTKAEISLDTAMEVNAQGVKNIATIAKKYSSKVIHFSTDFVFKGDKEIEYHEQMKTNPVNNYGLSKQKGEEWLQDILPDALIIRISWLYGPHGKNFVTSIASLLKEKPNLNIVADQYGKTTYTIDVAEATQNLINIDAKGIYHFANEGVCSRYDFTILIYELLKSQNDFICDIKPINASDYPDKTPRPKWSILSCDKYTYSTQQKIRKWEDALKHFVIDTVILLRHHC